MAVEVISEEEGPKGEEAVVVVRYTAHSCRRHHPGLTVQAGLMQKSGLLLESVVGLQRVTTDVVLLGD